MQEKLNLGNTQEWQKPADTDLLKPHNMPSKSRWQLYFYWVHRYCNQLSTKLEEFGTQYRTFNKQYAEIRNIEDVNLMKHMVVV